MNTTNSIATDLYPSLVKSHQLSFLTYLPMRHRLRSKADNSDPHPRDCSLSCPRNRPRSRPPSRFPDYGDSHLLRDSPSDPDGHHQDDSARGSVRCCPGSPDRRGARRRPRRRRTSSHRSLHGSSDRHFQSSPPKSSPVNLHGSSELRVSPVGSHWTTDL